MKTADAGTPKESKSKQWKKVSTETLTDLVLQQGMSTAEIARKYGMRQSSVSQRLKRLGIRQRDVKQTIVEKKREQLSQKADLEILVDRDLAVKQKSLLDRMMTLASTRFEELDRIKVLIARIAVGFDTDGHLLVKKAEEKKRLADEFQELVATLRRDSLKHREEFLLDAVVRMGPVIERHEKYIATLKDADALAYVIQFIQKLMEELDPDLADLFGRKFYAYIRLASGNAPIEAIKKIEEQSPEGNRMV